MRPTPEWFPCSPALPSSPGPLTPTPHRRKTDTAAILGPAGVRAILAALAAAGHASVPTVAIGGIDAANAAAVLAQARAPRKALDGLAVVSAIVASPRPAAAAARLLSTVLRARLPPVIASMRRTTPVSHNMTNLVGCLPAMRRRRRLLTLYLLCPGCPKLGRQRCPRRGRQPHHGKRRA